MKNKTKHLTVEVLSLEIGLLIMQGCSKKMEFVVAQVEKTWSSWR